MTQVGSVTVSVNDVTDLLLTFTRERSEQRRRAERSLPVFVSRGLKTPRRFPGDPEPGPGPETLSAQSQDTVARHIFITDIKVNNEDSHLSHLTQDFKTCLTRL